MQDIFDTLFEKLKYNEDSMHNLTDCLRQEAAKWACNVGSSWCTTRANSRLQWHLADLRSRILFPWWKEWTYCKGLIKADEIIWVRVFNTYIKEANNNKTLKFLACSENPTILRNYMEMAAKYYNEIISDNDHINRFHSIIMRHARNDIMLDYILSNFETVKPKEIDGIVALTDIINHVYTEEQLHKVMDFGKQNLEKAQISVTVGQMSLCRNELFYQLNKCTRTIGSSLISFFKRKIEMRSSEIKNQKKQFQNLMIK